MAPKGLFIGLTTIDIQYFTDAFPASNVKVKTDIPDIYVGGPATNAAVAFSFLGGKSHLYSFVGKNSFNELIFNDFKANNISHYDIGENQLDLPVLASVITSNTSGDRNIFTYNPPDIDCSLNAKEIVDSIKPDFLFIDGFYPNLAIQFLKIAKSKKLPVIFDGGSWKAHLTTLLPYIDIAICSDNFMPPNCNSKNDVVEFLSNHGIENVVITRGNKNILVSENKHEYEIQVEKIKPIDTLGAGDFFHGAFCYFQNEIDELFSVLVKSSKLATASCLFKGTREWAIKLKPEAFY